jgi:hypothetical protein
MYSEMCKYLTSLSSEAGKSFTVGVCGSLKAIIGRHRKGIEASLGVGIMYSSLQLVVSVW